MSKSLLLETKLEKSINNLPVYIITPFVVHYIIWMDRT